jgi:hypothetical protein
MRVISLILFFISIQNTWACSLKGPNQYISLSGPVTFVIDHLGLQKDKRLNGISIFNPVDKKKYKAKIYGGGIFLSEKSMGDFNQKVVFYDESRELEKHLKLAKAKKLIQIQTRDKDSFLVAQEVIKLLSPYLSKCKKKITKLNKRIDQTRKLLVSSKSPRTVLFYLGQVNARKKPNLLMVNDGVVKSLLKSKMIKTYPTDLAYVTWSEKQMAKLENPLHIGLLEGDNSKLKVEKMDSSLVNIRYQGVLTPGLSQVFFMQELLASGLL